MWACTGDLAQQWYGPSAQAGAIPPVYEVQASQASGFCLDNTGGSSADGNPVQVWSCSGNANQGWLYVPSVNGVAGDYQLQNASGLCLDNTGNTLTNGNHVQVWACTGDLAQQWYGPSADSDT